VKIVLDLTFTVRNSTGIGVYGRELLAALRAAGVGVQTYAAPGSAGHKWLRAAGALLGVECGLPLRLWRSAPDVLHAPAFIAPLAPLPCPLVVTVHDTILEDGRQPFHPAWRAFHRVHVRAALRRAAAVIVPTAASAADVARVYGGVRARVRVVPYGVNAAYRPLPPEAVAPVLARLGFARPYALFVGAQVMRKDIPTLIDAVARTPGLDLALAGPPGDATPAVRAALARHGLESRTHVLHDLETTELVALYNGAAVFAFPSRQEGGGLPPLEALACGTPVVAADSAAVREMLGDAAWFAPPGDAAALAATLGHALAGEALRADRRARGLARAADLSWARAAERTLAVYHEVCGKITAP
jgi:glycosyltransferase involved in cell wall biosynthesis